MFQVELVWSEKFHFVPFGTPSSTKQQAINFAKYMENNREGARAKKTRVVNEQGKVVWGHGRKAKVKSNAKDSQ